MAGRKAGRKNLKVKDGKLLNQYGVKFTEEEKKKLESLVNSANRKRKRLLTQEHDIVRMIGGKSTGKTIGETIGKMGFESDFVVAKKTKSLQRFRNKEEYNKYIKNLEKVVDREYVENRVEQYRKNHIKAIRNAFGKPSQGIIQKIKKMSIKEYMKMVQADPDVMQISYLYGPDQQNGKLEQIRSAMGVNKNAKNGGGLRDNNRPKRR